MKFAKELLNIWLLNALLIFCVISCDDDKKISDYNSNNSNDYVIGGNGPAGGYIFYDKGEYADGWRYMEAAPYDQEYHGEDPNGVDYLIRWGCIETAIDGADGTAVGTGEQNTIDIEAGCTTEGTPADICTNLNFGGYSDWFLPSIGELFLMYANLRLNNLGGFADGYYWSSSEYSGSLVWVQDFFNGNQNNTIKFGAHRVRAARSF